MLRECFCLLTGVPDMEKYIEQIKKSGGLFVGAARKAPSPVMEH